jgi:hypothetical protein
MGAGYTVQLLLHTVKVDLARAKSAVNLLDFGLAKARIECAPNRRALLARAAQRDAAVLELGRFAASPGLFFQRRRSRVPICDGSHFLKVKPE